MKKTNLLGLVILTSLMMSCANNSEEKIKDFATRFGDFVNTGQKDSVQKYYPDYVFTDSLATVPLSQIVVVPGSSEGSFRIEYAPDQSILIELDENGEIIVEESKGLFAFSSKQIEMLEKGGLYDSTLYDIEISELLAREMKKLDSFTSPDLDLFNLHGPVKDMTISYDSSSGSSESCFEAWCWAGNYNFDESGEWTNFRQRFKGGLKRNKEGQIVELYEFPEDHNAPDFDRSPFVAYQWKNNHVIKFTAGARTGNFATRSGSLTYDSNGVISGENMSWGGFDFDAQSHLKVHGFEFDQFGNWISCSWSSTTIWEEEEYALSSSNRLPDWLKNATASLNTAGIRDYYAMQDEDDSGYRRKTKETYSGTITRVITYYWNK